MPRSGGRAPAQITRFASGSTVLEIRLTHTCHFTVVGFESMPVALALLHQTPPKAFWLLQAPSVPPAHADACDYFQHNPLRLLNTPDHNIPILVTFDHQPQIIGSSPALISLTQTGVSLYLAVRSFRSAAFLTLSAISHCLLLL